MAKLAKDSLSHHQYQALRQAAAAKKPFSVAIEPLLEDGFTEEFLEENFKALWEPKKAPEKKPDPLK